MLKAVKPEPALVWREPAEEADVDVVIVAGDVDVSVMDRVVLRRPDVGAPPRRSRDIAISLLIQGRSE